MACRGLSKGQGHSKSHGPSCHLSWPQGWLLWDPWHGLSRPHHPSISSVASTLSKDYCSRSLVRVSSLGCLCAQWPKVLNAPLSEVDPELEDIIEHEKNRQWKVRGVATRLTCSASC